MWFNSDTNVYSEIFTDGNNKKASLGRPIKAYAIFKKGIQPKWEDPSNQNGCDIVIKKYFPTDILDIYWENLVLGVIGEIIEDSETICGCRVVDSTRKNAPHKIELWLNTTEPDVVNRVKAKLYDIIVEEDIQKSNGKPKIDFNVNRHS